MGIPKFFKFISERWPLISQLIDENQIPEFDNLYLDMNSILHTCTHSNDGSITRLSDDQMYAAIFNYIEHLFSIIKPQKTFYMAIDGVAPRAKMNQQRARRFRTAYEAELNLKKAIENGEDIPKEDPFDSNSITPGTEFMSKLTENLKYFIHKKITEDSQWANIEIILSGHEVPGEGEHKIMEFIRSIRTQPDYDPNLRHCIYGLDADLIMLGLVSHDPHFALLREEVKFGNKSQSSGPKDVTETNFFLLHLSLLREYLALEFKEIEDELSFEYDFERILDDFILIMYVIGNDFLPHLPDLHINKGAFPLLLSTFKQTLVQSDGYMNEDGKINLKRLNIWVHHLSEFEFENFEEKEVDIEWFNKKLEDVSITGDKKRKKIGKLLILKDQKKLVGSIKPWLMEVSSQPLATIIEQANNENLPTLKLNKEDVEKNLEFIKEFALQAGFLIIHSKSEDTYVAKLDVDGLPSIESNEDYEERINEVRKTIKNYQSANLIESEDILNDTKEVYQKKFKNWKNEYYEEKLNFSIDDTEKLTEMTEHYIEGLQWVLYYYYRGCPSWNWYYRYHYAPRISDISVGLEALINKGVDLKYDPSHPFKPFEQLMAVLPARSRKLMPNVYRPLMIDEKSPIKQFYPDEVDVDLNGKTASWEAVVLLDFVDENKLIEALKPIESKLTPEETKRNSYGYNVKFIHNPQIDKVFSSPLPGFFHDIEHDKCYEERYELIKTDDYRIGKIEGARTGTDLSAGFPTLKSISFTNELAQNEIKVFNYSSKSESMILNIENIWSDLSVKQFAQSFVGRLVYSNWPFLRECKVVKVVDEENKYETFRNEKGFKSVKSYEVTAEDRKQFKSEISNLNYIWDKTKGVKLGPIDVLLYVQPVNGLIRNAKGAYVKTFSKDIEIHPLQLIVKEVTHKDQRFATRPPLPIEEEFPINSQVTFLGDMGYGAPAQVVGYNGDKLSIKISKISSVAEPNVGKRRLYTESKEIQYIPAYDVAKTLRIDPLLLSKITSQFMIQGPDKKINIGLELKFESKRQKVLGYTRKSYNGKFWEFSPLAINLINNYKNKFPKLFKNLSTIQGSEIPKLSTVSDKEEIQQVKKWLKEVKEELILVSLESQSLTKFSFAAIEQYMENYILNEIPYINKDIRGVPRNAILNASESYQLLSEQKFELGDRVLYVQDFGKVPILSKGTVASIFTVGSKTSLGVIFDLPQLSGNTMNGKLKTNRGLMIDSSLVLNLTNKQFVYHSKASKIRKPMTEEEKIAKIKQQQQQRQQQFQSRHQPQYQSNNQTQHQSNRQTQTNGASNSKPAKILPRVNKKEENKPKNAEQSSSVKDKESSAQEDSKANASNKLLSLLKKDSRKNSTNDEDNVDEKSDETNLNNNAIKSVYNQIYSNVMNPNYPPQQPQQSHPYQFQQQQQQFPPQFQQQQFPPQFQNQQYIHENINVGQHNNGKSHQSNSTESKKEPSVFDRFLLNARKAEEKVKEEVEKAGEKVEETIDKKDDE
ncbi:exo2 [Candida pseudojiufengensis]|uniref:exo2 n=1 Tax=Candida pseudojiufengensis TaxID=497109 RepID=UPI002225A510|nr:exo2 [Candida pseudojiufengensis]KAI5962155.1 exo2 [Candida pseudojiufengensis]